MKTDRRALRLAAEKCVAMEDFNCKCTVADLVRNFRVIMVTLYLKDWDMLD